MWQWLLSLCAGSSSGVLAHGKEEKQGHVRACHKEGFLRGLPLAGKYVKKVWTLLFRPKSSFSWHVLWKLSLWNYGYRQITILDRIHLLGKSEDFLLELLLALFLITRAFKCLPLTASWSRVKLAAVSAWGDQNPNLCERKSYNVDSRRNFYLENILRLKIFALSCMQLVLWTKRKHTSLCLNIIFLCLARTAPT